jgi:hypothetical protein
VAIGASGGCGGQRRGRSVGLLVGRHGVGWLWSGR